MNVKLYYNQFLLGDLSYKNSGYLWTPNMDGINNALQIYPYGMEMFFLPNEPKTYSQVPNHFNEFLVQASRLDLMEKANILPTDNDMTKLYKLSKLSFYSQEFVIKS